MRTTIKTITDLAVSMDFKIDRPATECINVRFQNNSIAYTAQTVSEIYAWLQGYKYYWQHGCVSE